MRELLIVLQREFVERVRSRSFVVSTLLTPLFLAGFALVSAGGGGTDTFRLVIVDETPSALGRSAAEALNRDNAPGQDIIIATAVPGTAVARRDSLDAAVFTGEIDAYLRVPAEVERGGAAELRAEAAVEGATRRRIAGVLTSAAQAERLEEVGLDTGQLQRILAPVEIQSVRLAAEGDREVLSGAELALSLITGFFLYFLILLYGTQVMQSVQEEKNNRIAEVLVSSLRAQNLMLGKVLGVGAAALLQVGIWVALGYAIFAFREPLQQFGLPLGSVEDTLREAGPGMLVASLLYMLLGFFLYATMFAAVGAAAPTTEDAQRFTVPLIFPLVIPMLLAESVVTAPDDTAAVVASWVPLTAPLIMPMRLGAGGGSAAEVGGTLLMLVASVLAVGWIAGKIYRVGILSTGKRPTLGELARWLRAA